jgi:hypothetical protein
MNTNAPPEVDEAIEDIVNFLKARQVTLTIAESCTAGEVCSLIANVSGCGSVLYSGYVVYDERAKQECLGVRAETIRQFGLTSEEVAREMACGALNRHPPSEGRPNFATTNKTVSCVLPTLRGLKGTRLSSVKPTNSKDRAIK